MIPRHSPETNPQVTLPTPSTDDDFVAIHEEASFRSVGKRDWILTPPSSLQKAATILFVGTTDRTRGHHVSGSEIAAGRRVVRDHLRDRPVHVTVVADADPMWRIPRVRITSD